ncbi:MAG: zinc ribbon domain-containing protein [Burkholderiales bacterium]|jgi:putative FmdB family regulatory protein|nr:zinc ribbon domain-containing protein [Burkholderiales bacterium]
MPIYAYKCSSCGHEKDVLQKVSDAPLAACPACGSASFAKQLTAAGFQLKGSGWYATDFKNGASAKPDGKPTDSKSEGGEAKPAADPAAKPAAPATAAAPACGSGGCAACS